jgi:uncharacterized protein YecT (DUF1311 family)
MMALSGQSSMANGAQTACYRVLLAAFCALIAAVVLMMPAGLAAQQPAAHKADKKRILSCIATVEQISRQLPAYGLLSNNGSVDICLFTETSRCVRDNPSPGQTWRETWAACFAPEYDIWEELLKEAYGAMVEKLSKLDRQFPEPESALQLFEIAHRAWEAWAGVECEYQRALRKGGSDYAFASGPCMVVLMARQMLHYRSSL